MELVLLRKSIVLCAKMKRNNDNSIDIRVRSHHALHSIVGDHCGLYYMENGGEKTIYR